MNTETQVLQRVESEQAQSELPVIVPVEPKTSQQARIDEVNEALLPAYQKASELRLSDEENQALLVPFADDQVEIRPHDGLLYIPHIHISDRLIRVLGAGQWAMVRRREWIEANRIYAEYVMKVRGCFVGESVGAMDYHPSNPRMNYSDALEGTRGECIRRIAAKDLGCGSQVWNPEYCRQWVARYAEKDRKGQWQRKGQGNGHNQLSQTTQRQQPAGRVRAQACTGAGDVARLPGHDRAVRHRLLRPARAGHAGSRRIVLLHALASARGLRKPARRLSGRSRPGRVHGRRRTDAGELNLLNLDSQVVLRTEIGQTFQC